MNNQISQIVEYLQSELEPFTKVVWLLGSFLRNDFSKESDIDLTVITNSDSDVLKVNSKIPILSQRLEREVDITNFSIEDTNRKVMFNDYLLASLLEEEKYLFGDERFLKEIKENIFSKMPDEESIKYNLFEGIQTLDMAVIAFDNFKYYLRRMFRKTSTEPKELAEKVINDRFDSISFNRESKDIDLSIAESYLLQTVRNSVFAVGYVVATNKMKDLKRTISLRDMKGQTNTVEEKLFNELFLYEKHCKRAMEIDPSLVEKYLIASTYVFRKQFGL